MNASKNAVTSVIQTEANAKTDLSLPRTPDHTTRNPGRNLMNEIEVAQRLGLHANSVKNLTKRGILPRVKVPGLNRVLYCPDAVDALVRSWQEVAS